MKQLLEQGQAGLAGDLREPYQVPVAGRLSHGLFPFTPARVPAVNGPLVGNRQWKRAVDIVLSLIALVVLLPLFILAAAAIRLTSPGPVIFCQERVGLNRRLATRRNGGSRIELGERRNQDRRARSDFGKPFIIYKFRTMVPDAEKAGAVWAAKNDPRITPVGRILRKLRIDEIPQFVNVLLGDMSIVGPRPERSVFIAEVKYQLPEFPARLSIKPGISGLAQVQLGYTNTVEQLQEKLKLDLKYINQMTPWTDMKILARTLVVVLTARGT